ncbi:hypothetical protein C7N43_00695 [Sphingobacteriales bacterium UPWRP_1]|nr:hypothetical protein B6N25_10430 [Sphingobacteriales bacterium TSM_CSS]PSJ78992.1 hypothetical protein C7N43_00695 [Sphingobacteriales bacterium UPWRP_1]
MMPPIKRRVFKNDEHQQRFEADGYIILPIPDTQVIEELLQLYYTTNSGIHEGFYASLYSNNTTYKTTVDEGVRNICGQLPNLYLDSYRPLGGTFLVKQSGETSNLTVHQDWTIVDETIYTSVNFWLPLMDITSNNGPFMAMKGSHLLFDVLRGSPHFPSPLDGLRDTINKNYLTELKVQKGEVLFHDHRLVHASPPNLTNKPRIVAGMLLIPHEAQALHHYYNSNHIIEVFEIDDHFYSHFNIGSRPNYPKIKEIENYVFPTLNPVQLKNLYHTTKPSLWQRLKSKFVKF